MNWPKPRSAVAISKMVLGSGALTRAEKVISAAPSDSTRVPPLVTTAGSGPPALHCRTPPKPVIGPMEVNMAQEENAGSPAGPLIRSNPEVEARENPGRPKFWKNRVPVTNVKVPSEPIVIEADALSRENPSPPTIGAMLDVSAKAEIVIRAFVNDVWPIVPLAMVISVNVIGCAFAAAGSTTARAHASADARTNAEVLMCGYFPQDTSHFPRGPFARGRGTPNGNLNLDRAGCDRLRDDVARDLAQQLPVRLRRRGRSDAGYDPVVAVGRQPPRRSSAMR